MSVEVVTAGVILAALAVYVLGGGADFGGGVWDLLSTGPRAREQRETIADAIGPIWEANHVWLILVVVVLFVAFPPAFAAIATALHVPLTLMLIGIVLRGSAFTFRTYDDVADHVQRRWGRIFAIASVVTPVMLGVCVGAIASGELRADPATGAIATDFVSTWLRPFPFAIGFFTLALFAFLAAAYLTVEARTPALRDDFRARALGAGVAVGALAWLSLLLAGVGAPALREGLLQRPWSLPFQVLTGAAAVGALAALWWRRFALARILAILQTLLILCGWAAAQAPYLVAPDLTFYNAAAPPSVLRPLLVALAAGAVVLVPSLAYLFHVFKGRREAFEPLEGGRPHGEIR